MLYAIGISIYGLLIRIAALFSAKAKKWVVGRKNYWAKLPNLEGKKVIWFHCASLGEYDQGKPIMEAWKEKHPTDFILVTFFSPSGYENIKDKSVGDYTCYLPLDTKKNAKKFILFFKPDIAFFIKYEIWINLLKEAKAKGCTLYSISASFRKNHRFFKWYGGTFRKALSLFDHIFVQNKQSKILLSEIKISNVTVSGDTRYDRVAQRAEGNKRNTIIQPWTEGASVFIVGSSWPKDEEILIPCINNRKITDKVILAPHEIDDKHVNAITEQLKVSYQRYTELQKGEILHLETRVLILDCIGILAEVYLFGDLAYVGGGFGTGLHNILEPAAFGLPVLFGPIHDKFPEAEDFITAGIGKECNNSSSFYEGYTSFKEQKSIQSQVKAFIQDKRGATRIVMNKVSD